MLQLTVEIRYQECGRSSHYPLYFLFFFRLEIFCKRFLRNPCPCGAYIVFLILCFILWWLVQEHRLPRWLRGKNPPAKQEARIQSLSWEDPLEEEMATHSSTLAWEIPQTEEPGGLQSMGSQRVRHDLVTKEQQNPEHRIHY